MPRTNSLSAGRGSALRLAAGLTLCLLFGLAACAWPPATSLEHTSQPGPLPARQVAPGVYWIAGSADQASAANGARTGNVVFLVDRDGILVWNAGVSKQHGREILRTIRLVSDRPIRAVIISHPYQDLLFGAGAFQEQGIAVWMHEKSVDLILQRCEQCLRNLKRLIGDVAMAGTEVIKPTRLVSGSEQIELIGRPLQIIYPGWSSGPGDLALFDPATGTLLSGGMVAVNRVPEIRDAQSKPWRRALSKFGELGALAVRRVVPNHGGLGQASDIGRTADYLRQLESKVDQVMKNGVSLAEITSQVDLPDFAAWAGYDSVHLQNASRVYIQLEQALFD